MSNDRKTEEGKMKRLVIGWLLRMLNSGWLNQSPCKYEYVGNVDAFSRSHLEYEEKARPGITVKMILDEAAAFKACPLTNGLMVIEDGEYREATIWDQHDLRQSLTRPKTTESEQP